MSSYCQSFCFQVLQQLKVFSEDDVDAAAEALNDVSFFIFQTFCFTNQFNKIKKGFELIYIVRLSLYTPLEEMQVILQLFSQ